MRAIILMSVAAFALTACTEESAKQAEPTATTKSEKAKKPEKAEMTVERYCKYYNEADALMMEKYWPKLKDKEYAEVKDLYAAYEKERHALLDEHGIEQGDLASFFRTNFKAVEEYRAKDAAYKKYPDKQQAKLLLGKFAMARAEEKMGL